jgi:glycosyltransferase involved in cell wall biosynthesis
VQRVTPPRRVLFLALGRRGAVPKLALEIARALRDVPELTGLVAVPRGGEATEAIEATGKAIVFDMFASGAGALRLDRVLALRRRLSTLIREERIDTVVTVMPHVWTPLLAGAVRRARAHYVVIVHDARKHPGDRTGLVTDWLLRDARQADEVVTLSAHVAHTLLARGLVPETKVRTLFLPTLGYGAASRRTDRPFGVIFFGRILAYKGLDLLVEAAEILRGRGVAVRLGVAGEGDIGPLRARLEALGAEIENRWIGEDEVGPILARYDAMALPYVEASQSGVAAAALGAGLPMVATPVGGLREQVEDGRTGLLASRVDAAAFADALERLVREPDLVGRLREGSAEAATHLSMGAFLRTLLRL